MISMAALLHRTSALRKTLRASWPHKAEDGRERWPELVALSAKIRAYPRPPPEQSEQA
jgi:hypothetical protein